MIRQTVPVTLLTGFLGSGKTTLINRLLRESHGHRFAVIENEFGEVGVDAELLVDAPAETIVQLANGCVCCSVRGDLARALGDLVEGRARGTFAFDQVLIEASGMADPGPIARLFLSETALLEHFHLDGVLSLADALRGSAVFDEAVEAQAQIACADRILLSKPDQVEPAALERLRATLTAMNPSAEIEVLDLVRAPWGEMFEKLLDLRGYQFDRVRFRISGPAAGPPAATARHSPGVASVSFEGDRPFDPAALTAAFAEFDRRCGRRIWRIKGVLNVLGSPQRIVVQGVQGLLQANPGLIWRPFEPRRNRLVFIGRDLNRDWMLQRLRDCQAAEQAGMSAVSRDPPAGRRSPVDRPGCRAPEAG